MLVYFLKVNIAIALFYAFYRLFFYKDTFFSWRRTALLCFLAVSAAVPLLNIQNWMVEQEPMAAMADLYASVVLPELIITPGGPHTNWKSLIFQYGSIAYWAGVLFLSIRFFTQLISIIHLTYRCQKLKRNNSNLCLLPESGGPFSFFHWIFIHPASHSEEEFKEILIHEQTHARQLHSIDVIMSELACILCWFNPFIWLMKREIRTNLEYLADASVLENGYDSKAYQYHLLGLSHQKAAANIYNSFNVLPLKKRIKMMNKKRTKGIGRTKYLIFLPLAALLLIISNLEAVARTTKKIASEVIEAVDNRIEQPIQNVQSAPVTPGTETEQEKKTAKTVNKDSSKQDQDPVFEVVEQMPEFADGGIPGFMKYLSRSIKYPVKAQTNHIEGRVVVEFIVAKDGSITNVKVSRSVNPDLDQEAIRVISAMPKWKAGMQRGKAVNVRFSVPVMFRLQSKDTKQYKPANNEKADVVVTAYAPDGEKAFEVVEEMPVFPGGTPALMKYIAQSIKYPVEAQKAKIQGRVIVGLIVDKEGNPGHARIIRNVHPLLDAEALRIIKDMPKWEPGKQEGKPVNVQYTIPIVFKLQ